MSFIIFSCTIAVMKAHILSLLPASLALASRCDPSFFTPYLSSNASLVYARTFTENDTFVGPMNNYTGLPEYCALYVNVSSSPVSSYEFGLWLPTTTWNKRYMAYGNGGFTGQIAFDDMAPGLNYGFAVVSTNTGHNSSVREAGDAAWALDNPETRTDWGWRALHGSVELGKTLTQAFYNASIDYSYYAGCSTGGRQGLKSVQMFPEDFDGVLAGACAWWTTHQQNWDLKIALDNLPNDGPGHITSDLMDVLATEVLKQCDIADGVKDNIIMDGYACEFRPETLLCDGTSNSSSCFNAAQIKTLYKVYGDWVDTNQTFIFPSFAWGSEAQVSQMIITSDDQVDSPSGIAYPRDFVYNNPTWAAEDLDYGTIALSDALDPGNATAAAFDIRLFAARGGKLLHYHGFADGEIPTSSSIYYYKQTLATLKPLGVDVDSFYRFFLIPGMQHCTGSVHNAPWYIAAANQAGSLAGNNVYGVPGFRDRRHDAVLALMGWVEDGIAPGSLVATKFVDDTPALGVLAQRTLCPYPAVARYVGGDWNVTESFRCE
ncbi:Carboxylic ester hydrolase [Aspergillus mulundensis]|uniref:Carboxylic ester hydrolase n=1 Tax=Aspergillus mulundensis TaxID=1810919 RepID=A0A3D8RY72_9EURO|nr:Carboxylic ester hydrolase [Aspergillus mulundensis]RDW78958.1 Carboxylic ester hydrolase [Aspergillus mulundensis]